MALLKHIWSRSPAFFRALDDIKGLQGQVRDSLTHTIYTNLSILTIKGLQGQVRDLTP